MSVVQMPRPFRFAVDELVLARLSAPDWRGVTLARVEALRLVPDMRRGYLLTCLCTEAAFMAREEDVSALSAPFAELVRDAVAPPSRPAGAVG